MISSSHSRYAPVGDSLGNSWRIAGDGTNWGALSNCINLNSALQVTLSTSLLLRWVRWLQLLMASLYSWLQAYARPGAWNDPDLLQGTGVGSNDKATNPSGCFDPKFIPQSKNWYQTEAQSRAQFSMCECTSAAKSTQPRTLRAAHYARGEAGSHASAYSHTRDGGSLDAGHEDASAAVGSRTSAGALIHSALVVSTEHPG